LAHCRQLTSEQSVKISFYSLFPLLFRAVLASDASQLTAIEPNATTGRALVNLDLLLHAEKMQHHRNILALWAFQPMCRVPMQRLRILNIAEQFASVFIRLIDSLKLKIVAEDASAPRFTYVELNGPNSDLLEFGIAHRTFHDWLPLWWSWNP
jgi:hypothetical protein